MNWKCFSTLRKFKLGSSRALICLLTQTETLKLELLCMFASLLYSWASAPYSWRSPCPVGLCLLYPHCWIWQSTLAALSKSQLPAVSCDRMKPVLTAAAFFRALMPFIKSFFSLRRLLRQCTYKIQIALSKEETSNVPCLGVKMRTAMVSALKSYSEVMLLLYLWAH